MNKPLTKKQRRALIDAWASLQVLCSCLEDNRGFTPKYSAYGNAREILRKLDSVVSVIYEDDL